MYFSSTVCTPPRRVLSQLLIQSSNKLKRGPSGFDWGGETVRGVNLGGWLVLEVSIPFQCRVGGLRVLTLSPAMDHSINLPESPSGLEDHRRVYHGPAAGSEGV